MHTSAAGCGPLAVAAVLGTLGCATFQPGAGVDRRLSEQWACDHEFVQQMAAEAKAELEASRFTNWIPQVGWDACQVLARIGAPKDTELQQTTAGRSASWWYQDTSYGGDPSVLHLVSLEHKPATGRWVVTYVGW